MLSLAPLALASCLCQEAAADIDAPLPRAERHAAEPRWPWGEEHAFDLNLYGNFFARKERKPVFDGEGNEVGDVARIRQIDLITGFTITDGVDALIAGGVQSTPLNDEFEVEFEQAYVEFTRLPVLGDLPHGLTALVGQYRASFGRLNRERLYDLPQITRPRALTTFLGETGYSQTGVSGTYTLDVGSAGAVVVTGEYMDSGSPPFTIDDGGAVGGSNLRLSWVSRPRATHGFELGASKLHARRADQEGLRSTLLGADALYAWRPDPERAPRLWLGGELVQGEIDLAAGGVEEPIGYYAWTQLALGDRWFVGARYDVSDELEDDALRTRTESLYVTYNMAAGARFSVAVERSQSDVELMDDVTRVFVEFNFAAGTGPHRPFWMQ